MAENGQRFKASDYLALGLSLMLAFGVWLIHNLSLEYSALVQRAIVAQCEIDGHSNISAEAVEIAASCEMSGLDLMAYRMEGRRRPVHLTVSPDDMHAKGNDVYYMTSAEATKYFHLIFTDRSKLEYFVTDTLFFTFKSVEHKKVPVKVMANVSYKPQYMSVTGLKASPDSVYIYGDKEIIDVVDHVTTDVVKLYELDSETYGSVNIKPINGVRISAKSISYNIPVVRYVQREIMLPVRTSGVPRGVELKVYPPNVKMTYKMRFPADADMSDVYVRIDYEDFNHSRKGKCVGMVENLPEEVLQYGLEKEVFECLLEVNAQ